jgi:hypothetical protein
MRHLVRVLEKEDGRKVQLFLGNYDSMKELEGLEPTKEAPAGDHVEIHDRLNDNEYEAERYFEILTNNG